MKQDADGFVYFVDRIGDTFRYVALSRRDAD